jgi:hypothetical protein
VATVAATLPTARSGNIQNNNQRREVGPLQASTPGPVQVATLSFSTTWPQYSRRRQRINSCGGIGRWRLRMRVISSSCVGESGGIGQHLEQCIVNDPETECRDP